MCADYRERRSGFKARESWPRAKGCTKNAATTANDANQQVSARGPRSPTENGFDPITRPTASLSAVGRANDRSELADSDCCRRVEQVQRVQVALQRAPY